MIDAAIIEKEAMQLSAAERALLADRLPESLGATSKELQSSWVKEADDRLKAYREGSIVAEDGPQALSDLRNRLGE
ncbi:MAG: addiction module protein [Verrucomicrobia bacterium]|nr:addiction module protein [Verrucomicrobiota bacterium]MDA1006430.1 addiction module protein [Verrucomicrobiota bacterium]